MGSAAAVSFRRWGRIAPVTSTRGRSGWALESKAAFPTEDVRRWCCPNLAASLEPEKARGHGSQCLSLSPSRLQLRDELPARHRPQERGAGSPGPEAAAGLGGEAPWLGVGPWLGCPSLWPPAVACGPRPSPAPLWASTFPAGREPPSRERGLGLALGSQRGGCRVSRG